MTFDEAFAVVIGHEGGLSDHPDDPGGLTKFGISQRAYPHVDIRNLTLDDAKAIYRRDYWEPVRGQELPDAIALQVFDAAVNHGVRASIRMIQSAVGTTVDGVLGPKTFAAIWRTNPLKAAIKFNAARLEFYTTLPTFASFGRGWVRRVAANLREI